MQREQERERRRIRDRQRRQSMTQEQRERHLARRRRNYQLRRQRAANACTPFPQFQPQESSACEASTSDEFQASSFLDYAVLSQGIGFSHHDLNQGQETLNLGTKVFEGSSVPLETLFYKQANVPRRMRLNHIRGLARNLKLDSAGNQQVVAELIAKEDQDVSAGTPPKSLRLNCVKRIARSKNSPPKVTTDQKDLQLPPEGIQLPGHDNFITNS